MKKSATGENIRHHRGNVRWHNWLPSR